MRKRKEIPVRNNPGIYKEIRFDHNRWKETGKYLAIRRVVRDNRSRKEQAIFDNIEYAKSFRAGILQKGFDKTNVHKNDVDSNDGAITFGSLVEEWKSFHYLQLVLSTRQTYERRLPHLSCLNHLDVEKINTAVVDNLVKFWVTEYPKSDQRESFEKEFNLLKVILNFYRKRKNPKIGRAHV